MSLQGSMTVERMCELARVSRACSETTRLMGGPIKIRNRAALQTRRGISVDPSRGGSVMSDMVHASDHQEAPALKARAHYRAVKGLPGEIHPSLFERSSRVEIFDGNALASVH